jgi:ubiquinone/menaquinone biosynthesis C-methylase UbiE
MVHSSDPMVQVGRTVSGMPVAEATLNAIITDVGCKLHLDKNDTLLDVCCGNGVLTHAFSKTCHSVVGVDVSHVQIESAKRSYSSDNIQYFECDAIALSRTVQKRFSKVLLYFSFQYFDTYRKGERVIEEMLRVLQPNGMLLIGDVPEKERICNYYHMFYKRALYCILLCAGHAKHGKFWSIDEISSICHKNNATVRRLDQPVHLPYARYRCDFLITRTNS